MKACIIIPCYNHAATIVEVARAAVAYCPVMVVDDGSIEPVDLPADIQVVRLEQNRGKAAALCVGFERAADQGFTHAITMDADGQHFPEDLPKFLEEAAREPSALLVGIRDFLAAGAPARRRRANAFSNFWFRIETGLRLADTQCGFRCYPLALVRRLRVRSARYAYELEVLVRATWAGAALVPVPVRCQYQPQQIQQSHFRPLVDTLRISRLNMGLVFQGWCVPPSLRQAWSLGERRTLREVWQEFFSEHAQEPGRVALAVGLGLFCGIAPIWGYQMVAAAALAHWLRLNKAIALVASNISIPPIAPFILYGGLVVGHWLFTGQRLVLSTHALTMSGMMSLIMEYVWQWFVGSFALGALVAACGTLITYTVARVVQRR